VSQDTYRSSPTGDPHGTRRQAFDIASTEPRRLDAEHEKYWPFVTIAISLAIGVGAAAVVVQAPAPVGIMAVGTWIVMSLLLFWQWTIARGPQLTATTDGLVVTPLGGSPRTIPWADVRSIRTFAMTLSVTLTEHGRTVTVRRPMRPPWRLPGMHGGGQ